MCIYHSKKLGIKFLPECDPYYALSRDQLSVTIMFSVPVLKKIEKIMNTIKLSLNIFFVCCGQNKS